MPSASSTADSGAPWYPIGGTTTAGDTIGSIESQYMSPHERNLIQIEQLNDKSLQKIITKLCQTLIPELPNSPPHIQQQKQMRGPRHPYWKKQLKRKLIKEDE